MLVGKQHHKVSQTVSGFRMFSEFWPTGCSLGSVHPPLVVLVNFKQFPLSTYLKQGNRRFNFVTSISLSGAETNPNFLGSSPICWNRSPILTLANLMAPSFCSFIIPFQMMLLCFCIIGTLKGGAGKDQASELLLESDVKIGMNVINDGCPTYCQELCHSRID